MLVGYARVSTKEQNLDLQVQVLNNAWCDQIFPDITSGAKAERPGFNDAMMVLRVGDTLAVGSVAISRLC